MCHCLRHYTLLATVLAAAAAVVSADECGDTTIRSTAGHKNGNITSPNYPNRYGPYLRCLYYLIGQRSERVWLKFEDFDVSGVLPSCRDDYVDVYTQARSPSDDLLLVPLHGRYCGADKEKLPELLISMTNILVVGLYTASTVDNGLKRFSAKYRFIDDSKYNVGTPAPDTCGQTIDSIKSGVLLSPTYPGMYPDHIFCFYKIIGSVGQRVKLTFTEIDLYSGGDHCPFDYIKVYDGPDNEAEEIKTYCGSISENVTIFSTGRSLNIVFETKSGRAEATKKSYITYYDKEVPDVARRRRGFRAVFDVSDNFVDLRYIQGRHVRGTQCDQVIFSERESSGTVTSPYYPDSYPLNVRCIYYIDGLHDKQHLEKVKLTITDIDIPSRGQRCENGYLQVFVQGRFDETDSGYQMCGDRANPDTLTTTNPRLLMVFNGTGHRAGKGFSAHYQFITDYAIPGTPAATSSQQCSFIYRSSSGVKAGPFFSPRHPSYYPDNTVCIYTFIGLSNEQVRITFENFKVENGGANCSKDQVAVYNVAPRPYSDGHDERTLVGVYCGDKLPGPQMSEENSNQMIVRLTTNDGGVKAGFRAKYEFVEKSPDKRCVENVTGSGGNIKSPNYPNKYYTNRTCEWYIYSRHRQGRIMLIIHEFKMEGNPQGVGCGNCVLKIYTNTSGLPAYELCGENKSYVGRSGTILSQDNMLRLKFISSAKAVGGNGFILSWTDLAPDSGRPNSKCDKGFRCKKSKYCIAEELQCNRLPNCGFDDTSDETDNCGHVHARSGVLNIILGIVLTAILVVVIVFCVIQLRRRRHRKKHETVTVHFLTHSAVDNTPDLHVGHAPASSDQSSPAPPVSAANGGHHLFTEQTEKVSIL